MAAPRYRPSKDRNHNDVVARFEQWGATVFETPEVGAGFTDLVVGLCGITLLVEVKDGERPPSERKLRDTQQKFADTWKGGPVLTVETLADVDRISSTIRRKHARGEAA